jgi:hypothetical protein
MPAGDKSSTRYSAFYHIENGSVEDNIERGPLNDRARGVR